jgi:predicted house-cleaning noncanonical NTP pyrophosphatase (MazG superfamily)
MEERRDKFEKIYEEYKRLVVSTHIEAQILKPGQPYKVNYIKPEELTLRKELAKKLVNEYKDFFEGKPAEWFDLQRDTN